MKTKDPIYEFETALRALGGTDERYGGAVMANLPIVDDQLAFRLAAEYDRFETDINYPTYDEFDRYDELIEDENFTLRGKLLIEPKGLPEARAVLTYSYSEDRPIPHDIAGPGARVRLRRRARRLQFPESSRKCGRPKPTMPGWRSPMTSRPSGC